MGLNISAPTLIKIREGISVNLGLVVSLSIEKGAVQKKIKAEVQKLIDARTFDRQLTEEDYEVVGNADTISFWFIGGTSLTYRVGLEIEQSDFDRIEDHINSLNFRGKKNDGKPSNDDISK